MTPPPVENTEKTKIILIAGRWQENYSLNLLKCFLDVREDLKNTSISKLKRWSNQDPLLERQWCHPYSSWLVSLLINIEYKDKQVFLNIPRFSYISLLLKFINFLLQYLVKVQPLLPLFFYETFRVQWNV